MVKITFKNVGQGDSIIIEWTEDGLNRIGIIDCNVYLNTNPVIEHIKELKTQEIEFLIMSHPHMDHFSGFKQLLDFCIENDIKINRFLHTALSTPDYLKSATYSIDEESKLIDLFNLLNDLEINNLINVYSIDSNPNIQIPLGQEFKMEILSPSSREINKYIKGEKYPFNEEKNGNPNANWLSTLFKIYNKEVNILLTSDVENGVLKRIGKRKGGRLGKGKIILAQSPHHGSKRNLNKPFWQMRKRNRTTPIVISVGKNRYNHPSEEVINFFSSLNNYDIYRTDIDYQGIKQSNQAIDNSNFLDMFSEQNVTVGQISFKDRIYEIIGKNINIIN